MLLEEVKMRSLPMCAAWLILTGACLALLSIRTQPLEIVILMILALYAIQAFIAEALGVRVTNTSISFPRRVIANFPFFILWRMSVRCAEIDQISSRPKARVRVHKNTGERLQVSFPSREARQRFFQFVKRVDPSIVISR